MNKINPSGILTTKSKNKCSDGLYFHAIRAISMCLVVYFGYVLFLTLNPIVLIPFTLAWAIYEYNIKDNQYNSNITIYYKDNKKKRYLKTYKDNNAN